MSHPCSNGHCYLCEILDYNTVEIKIFIFCSKCGDSFYEVIPIEPPVEIT